MKLIGLFRPRRQTVEIPSFSSREQFDAYFLQWKEKASKDEVNAAKIFIRLYDLNVKYYLDGKMISRLLMLDIIINEDIEAVSLNSFIINTPDFVIQFVYESIKQHYSRFSAGRGTVADEPSIEEIKGQYLGFYGLANQNLRNFVRRWNGREISELKEIANSLKEKIESELRAIIMRARSEAMKEAHRAGFSPQLCMTDKMTPIHQQLDHIQGFNFQEIVRDYISRSR